MIPDGLELDAAVEAFSERVSYENEEDAEHGLPLVIEAGARIKDLEAALARVVEDCDGPIGWDQEPRRKYRQALDAAKDVLDTPWTEPSPQPEPSADEVLGRNLRICANAIKLTKLSDGTWLAADYTTSRWKQGETLDAALASLAEGGSP